MVFAVPGDALVASRASRIVFVPAGNATAASEHQLWGHRKTFSGTRAWRRWSTEATTLVCESVTRGPLRYAGTAGQRSHHPVVVKNVGRTEQQRDASDGELFAGAVHPADAAGL